MTQAATLAAIRALPDMTVRYDSDAREYRVTFATHAIRAANLAAKVSTNFAFVNERAEAVSYYTDDASDAVDTAKAMQAQGYRA
jgi:hypothetical protein